MSTVTTATVSGNHPEAHPHLSGRGLPANFAPRFTAYLKILYMAAGAVVLATNTWAVPSITLANGVANPPPPLSSTGLNPRQIATADTATLVASGGAGGFATLAQAVLTAQGYTAANNWTLNTNTVTLANNATFNITDYHLFLNATGTAFGERFDFTLAPNLAGPVIPAGSTGTLHWLQLINEDTKLAGGTYGFAINGQQGFWALDNGFVNGAAAGGATPNANINAPYYDSNNAGGGMFSVPGAFSDEPKFFSGDGKYVHFLAIPTWDVFTPAAGGNPATETIYTADYGIRWGFQISAVPEPGSLWVYGIAVIAICSGRLVQRRWREKPSRVVD